MNFPDNDLTGTLAEQDLERLFTSWRWVTGKDRIDIGYDLCVVPDISRFKGARFLVQSKGTSKRKKGNVVAQVSKKRLRQYAENPHPVFIIRVIPDGTAYWIHAQDWAKNNIHKLSGDGYSGVRFDTESTLDKKEEFISYLDKVMRPAYEESGSLRNISSQRSKYLSNIDPRFNVKVNLINGNESYEIINAHDSQETSSAFTIKPAPAQENIEKIMEAINFGVPASVDVDEFRMERSPLFEELGLCGPLKGKIQISPKNTFSGTIFLCPGERHSITATELSVPARLFSGQKGALITNEEFGHVFDLRIRLEQGIMNLNFSINESNLSKRTAESWDELSNAVDWAEQALNKKSLRIDLAFRGTRTKMPAIIDVSKIEAFLCMVVWLGKLHALAKYFCADIFLPDSYILTEEEESDVSLAYKVLRGEQCPIRDMCLQFDAGNPVAVSEGTYDFRLTTNFSVFVAGRQIGIIPIQIDLPGYVLTRNEGVEKYIIKSGAGDGGTISFCEETVSTGLIQRL